MEEGEARQALQGAGPPEEQALAQQQQEDGGGDPHQEGQQLEVTDQVVNQQAPVIEGVLEKADHQQESPREKEGAVEAEIDAGIQAEGQSTEGGEVQAQYESEARMMEATAELSTGEGEVLLGDVSGEARAAISYTRDQFARCLGPGELSRDLVAPHHVFGIDTSRLENLKCVEPGIFMHTSGNSLSVLSLDTAIDYKRRIKRRESLFGLDGGGIGCFTLHPSGKLVAVGERGDSPNIYIYSYPALTLVNVLKEGTERGYSCLAFNAAGDKLASVGQSPDFLLTIWEWRDEKVTLHTKAFGQEVFRVAFSPYDEGRLVTSGTGHIRFWRMASTFTGLKLQGDIGKFGKVELSDISAFDILPDGKVLSGSESGHLLLWEGNFIKCRFVLAGEGGDKGCHDGEVTVLRRDGDAFMTAGLDGWIRWWSLVVIDGAEVDTDHSMDFEISPIREMHAGMGVAIQCLERGGERGSSSDYFLITDANGSLRQLAVNNLPSEGAYSAKMEAQAVFEFHSGQVNDLDTCPKEHLAASAGADGSIRLWDYVHKNMLEMERFSAAVTCLQWMRESVDPTGRTIAAGFADGVLRFLVRGGKTLQCTAVAKPHSCAIVDLSISPSGQRIATAGKDGTIFLFNIGSGAGSITPAGFIDKQALGIPSGLSWRADSLSLMCTFDGGAVCEASLAGGALDGANTKNSYDITALVPCQEFYLQVKETVLQKHGSAADLDASDEQCEQLTPGDASPDETSSSPSDSPPNATAPSIRTTQGTAPALQSVYLPEEKHFLVSYGGWAAGQIYECSWDAVEPLASYAMGSEGTVRPSVLHMKTALGGKLLLSGSDDGCVTVRPLERCKGAAAFARVLLHIGHMSVKTCAAVSYDGDWLVTAGGDGLVSSCRIRVHDLLEAAAELAPTVPVQPLLPAALASPVPSAMERKKLANDGAATTETKSGAVPSFWLRSHDGEEGDPAVTDLSKYNFKTGEHLPEPSMYAAVEHEVEDAVVASGYSIEEEKLKREEGNRLREASDRKAAVRAVVASMREEYERLVTENAQLPADVRLSPESMRPDAHLLEFIELNRKELTEEVHREVLHESELSMLRERKLREHFFDGLEMEHMVLKALQWEYHVSSFRVEKFTPHMLQALEDLRESIRNQEIAASKAKGRPAGGARGDSNESDSQNLSPLEIAMAEVDEVMGNFEKSVTTTGSHSQAPSSTTHSGSAEGSGPHLSTFEIRKERRRLRHAALAKLEAAKPMGDADDPRDLAAIARAEENLGYYKLKTTGGAACAEAALDVVSKQRQMLLLEESIHSIKMRFNERFLTLRGLKAEIIEGICRDNERSQEIERELAESNAADSSSSPTSPWEPKFDPSEWPAEVRDHVSQDDLKVFEQAILAAGGDVASAAAPPVASSVPVRESTVSAESCPKSLLPSAIHTHVGDIRVGIYDHSPAVKAAAMAALARRVTKDEVELSPMEADEAVTRVMLLQQEKMSLAERTAANVLAFDEALYELRRERILVAADLKAAEQTLLLMRQELELLKQYDARDSALAKTLIRCSKDKAEVVAAVSDCNARLGAKRMEMEVWQEKESALLAEFKAVVPPSHPFYDPLHRIFRRKMKRSRKQLSSEALDDDKENESSDDDEDYSDDDGDDEDDYDSDDDGDFETDDSCPPGCDMVLYERVLEQREQRLDLELSMADLQKSIDEMKRALDRQVTRQRQIDKDLTATDREISAVQLEKQATLNEFDVPVSLKLNQLHCMVMPSTEVTEDTGRRGSLGANRPKLTSHCDTSTHVLFTRTHLGRLQSRIKELGEETSSARNSFKDLQRDRTRLDRGYTEREAELEVATSRCRELQLLKFGQIIDLDVLDRAGTDAAEAAAARKVAAIETGHAEELAHLTTERRRLQGSLIQETGKNTALLQEIAAHSARQLNLEKDLNRGSSSGSQSGGGGSSWGDTGPIIRRQVEERNRLVSLVKLQARELDTIRGEINLLRRKGGYSYPGAQLPSAAAT